MKSGRRIVVSTCGTSILTNALRGDPDGEDQLKQFANCIESELPADVLQRFSGHAERVCANALTVAPQSASRLSAEINGILRLYDHSPASDARRDLHYLVHSDTWLGQKAAEIEREWLEKNGIPAVLQCAECLTAASTLAFSLGARSLVEFCATLPDQRGKDGRVVFHLSGGWKSLQGYMTVLGMVYADEIAYVYEHAELLRIPRLPVQLDPKGALVSKSEVARRLSLGLAASGAEVEGIPESLLDEQRDGYHFSVWGEAAWGGIESSLYKDSLLASPCERIRYGPGFERTTQPHRGRREMVDLNRCIDKLVRQVVLGQPTSGLDLKLLRDAKSFAPSTHECDAWHDGQTGRLFGHFEGDVFVLDQLHAALHR